MGMVVKNNMSAVRTLNTLNANSTALQKSLTKVSSGMKINSAQDDASGYAISERMRVRIRSLDQANQNTQNDSSLMKTAEGAVGNTVEILRALKEKAINAANDSNTEEDRQTIQKEINQFIDQIDDNALVQFNGKYLVDGSKNNAATATQTVLLNQSLDKNSAAASALTELNNRAGDSLGIQNTDKWQVSWVQNGKINFTSGDVGGNTIAAILATAGADGVAAKTAADGAITTTETPSASTTDPMDGYTDTGKTISAITSTKNASAIASALNDLGLTKDGVAFTEADITVGDITTDQYTEKTDGSGNIIDATALKVTITEPDPTGDAGRYTLTLEVNTTGKIYTQDAPQTGGSAVDGGVVDKFKRQLYTPDGTEGIAFTANDEGVDNQISGLTISILDQDGNVKKAANAALDQFKQYQRAENNSGDMSLNFHVGSEANVAIKVGMTDMRSQALGLKGSDGTRINVYTKENANAAINVIENALTKALDQQTTIGAIEARLEYTSTNLTTSSENVQAAESTIRDADMAKEMTNYTKSNVLLQAAQAMLAQANQNSSAVLSLLQ